MPREGQGLRTGRFPERSPAVHLRSLVRSTRFPSLRAGDRQVSNGARVPAGYAHLFPQGSHEGKRRQRMVKRGRLLVAGATVLAILATACGGDGAGGDQGLSGSIFVSGSSTVEPISAL